jgi:hypothetical protein
VPPPPPSSLQAGLYNPYTLAGTILVNQVLASSHSRWFADAAADALGLPTRWLPALYQAALAPARALYRLLGPQQYVALYRRLDAQFDLAASCSGGLGAAASTAGLLALAWAQAAAGAIAPHTASLAAAAAALLAAALLAAGGKGAAAAGKPGSRQASLMVCVALAAVLAGQAAAQGAPKLE